MSYIRIVLVAVLIYAAQEVYSQTGGVASEVSELIAARISMKSFANVAVDIPEFKRAKYYSIEQIYAHVISDDPNLTSFASSGSTWNFVDFSTSKKYSYLVYPNLNGMDPKKAIFIATPREVNIAPGKVGRVLLTHSLDIVILDEQSFHAHIASQVSEKNEK